MNGRVAEIPVANECVLRGMVWSEGDTWVVLLHEPGADHDLDRWRPLVPYLLGDGLSVLTLDLRGHGASDGSWRECLAAGDIASTVRWVRQQTAGCVVLVAEGTTGIDAMRAMENDAVDGLVLLGARIRTTSVATSDLPRGAGVPRLFITGAGIADAVTDAARLRANAIGWAAEVSLPTAQQGTTLLEGDWALDVRGQILGFIREQRFLTRTRIRKASMLGTAAGPLAHTSSEPVTGGDG